MSSESEPNEEENESCVESCLSIVFYIGFGAIVIGPLTALFIICLPFLALEKLCNLCGFCEDGPTVEPSSNEQPGWVGPPSATTNITTSTTTTTAATTTSTPAKTAPVPTPPIPTGWVGPPKYNLVNELPGNLPPPPPPPYEPL